jgi:diguanylate cyclase (GGDEF)-like protein
MEKCGVIRPGECLCGQAVAKEEIIVSLNSAKDPRHTFCRPADKIPGHLPAEPHGHIIVPLKAVDKIVGILNLYTYPDTEVDENLLKLLNSIGGQIGIAINNANLYEETKAVSLHDPLTGLANRRFMQIQFEKSFESAKRYGEELSVVMLDIDHFKIYNDTYGHTGGDRLLVKLAEIIVREMRKADYVFRYGGEEFLIIFPGTGLAKTREAAERLRLAVEAETGVTISLGVASLTESVKNIEDLIVTADQALYRAKEGGRNRVET